MGIETKPAAPSGSGLRPLAGMWLTAALLVSVAGALACETDADCGPHGTCIKRERRAEGVCYGGKVGGAVDESAPVVEVPSLPVTGQRRENAKAWLGDPDQMIHDNLPGKAVSGPCTVTQDCPAGFDCVVAGFEGHCVQR